MYPDLIGLYNVAFAVDKTLPIIDTSKTHNKKFLRKKTDHYSIPLIS